MLDCKNCKYYNKFASPRFSREYCGKSIDRTGTFSGTVEIRNERAGVANVDCGPSAKFYYPKEPTELEKEVFKHNANHKTRAE